jgi:hypothetical protein
MSGREPQASRSPSPVSCFAQSARKLTSSGRSSSAHHNSMHASLSSRALDTGDFRRRVEGVAVRAAQSAPSRLRPPPPAAAALGAGDLPTLQQLGVAPAGRPSANPVGLGAVRLLPPATAAAAGALHAPGAAARASGQGLAGSALPHARLPAAQLLGAARPPSAGSAQAKGCAGGLRGGASTLRPCTCSVSRAPRGPACMPCFRQACVLAACLPQMSGRVVVHSCRVAPCCPAHDSAVRTAPATHDLPPWLAAPYKTCLRARARRRDRPPDPGTRRQASGRAWRRCGGCLRRAPGRASAAAGRAGRRPASRRGWPR